MASTPTMTCASRHAMVVKGSGRGGGIGEIDGRPVRTGVHIPAVGHRLPEVLVIGQALEARTQLVCPVEVQLVGQQFGVHEPTLTSI